MARIKIDEILQALNPQLIAAFRSAVDDVIPNNFSETSGEEVDADELCRAFKQAFIGRCGTWVTVPDSCVED